MAGPLDGLRVVEIAGMGPAPFAAMLLADLGALVVRVDRIPGPREPWQVPAPLDALNRGKWSVAVDLKDPRGVDVVLRLVADVDVLIEGFRPGVAERLGIGPEPCLARNPALVYGRMTGWGQTGPLARTAGHDIDYIAVAGALEPIGPVDGPPLPPLAFVGDFGGGGMLLAFGVVSAVLHARATGVGQVVDAAVVDGAALLTTATRAMLAAGLWREERGANLLDGGAPYYRAYRTADGKHVAVGALEERFYRELLFQISAGDDLPARDDPESWPALHARLEAVFATRTRDEWMTDLSESDACVAPVLSLSEAPSHPHAVARAAFVDMGGHPQPAPAPRFDGTPAAVPLPPPDPGADTARILAAAGWSDAEILALRTAGVVA